MIGHRNRLTAGMRLRHLSLAAFLGHALAAVALRRSHGIRLHRTRHDGSRKQQERQQRDTDFANGLHGPELSIETVLIRRNTRSIVTEMP